MDYITITSFTTAAKKEAPIKDVGLRPKKNSP